MSAIKLWSKFIILLGILFGIIYAAVAIIGTLLGIGSFLFYGILAGFFLILQYIMAPKIVELTMRVRYVSENEAPRLHRIVEELASKAGIPKPKVGISEIEIPNAFAFGRSIKDGRVVVTRALLQMLDENELKAVIGHEISHIKHRDMLVITLLSIIPMIFYYIAFNLWWSSMFARERGNYLALIGILAFIIYFITNLLVLYASRIREYYADYGSVKLGNQPHHLASALYKIVYGSARIAAHDDEAIRRYEAVKAFFLNDPRKSLEEISDLRQIDIDRSGKIEMQELMILKRKKIKLSFADRLMELFSTHPNTLKRIKYLSTLYNVS